MKEIKELGRRIITGLQEGSHKTRNTTTDNILEYSSWRGANRSSRAGVLPIQTELSSPEKGNQPRNRMNGV